ncbi:MAG: methionine--tRNA ligase subunit beta [Planctomycetota bacterium]
MGDESAVSEGPSGNDGSSGPDRPTVSFAEFKKLELRVATVLEAKAHPNADKLLLLRVRVGDREKQIVAGIRKYRDPEALVGGQIVVADNLEPAVLRGERSEGMLLAVLDGDEFALLVPDAKVRDGSLVT